MLNNKLSRYALFGLLYFAQGSILAYFTALNALYLLSFNLSMSQVGIFSAVALIPFVLKIFFGMLSSAVIGVPAQTTSWLAAFWGLGLVTLLPLILVLRVREPARPPERQFQWRAFKAFARRPVSALALLGALYSLVINGANEVVNPFLQKNYGISLMAAGFYTAVWGVGVQQFQIWRSILSGAAGFWLRSRRMRPVHARFGVLRLRPGTKNSRDSAHALRASAHGYIWNCWSEWCWAA